MSMVLPVTIVAAPADMMFARKLQTDLGARGVQAAVESDGAQAGPPRPGDALAHLLERPGACLIVLSPAALSGDLVARLRNAVAARLERGASVRLLFVSLVAAESDTLPFQFAEYPLLDLTRIPYDAALGSIVALLRTATITGAPAPQPLASSAPQEDSADLEDELDAVSLNDITLRSWGRVAPDEPMTGGQEPERESETEAQAPYASPPPPVPSQQAAPTAAPWDMPASSRPAAPAAPWDMPAYGAPGAPPLPPGLGAPSYAPPPAGGHPAPPVPYPDYPYPTPGSLRGRLSSGGAGRGFGTGGGSGRAQKRGKRAPAPAWEKSALPPVRELPLEQATFTAYHPREMPPRVWQPLLVYIALDTPAALAQVAAAANERLAGRREQFRAASGAATGLRRGSKLTIVPEIPGFRTNPPEMTVAWEEDAQQHEFRLRAETAQAGRATNGSVKIYMGPILRGEIPVSIFVQPSGIAASQPDTFASAVARAYRRVFASYSHRDTAIVRCCETAAQTMGDRYLRDVTLLRSGEQWDERLLDAVTEADIFQLFWSAHAATSPAVEKEWRRALSLVPVRGQFIRPVFWSREPYTMPSELAPIHFEKLDLARLGWGPARSFLYTVLGIG